MDWAYVRLLAHLLLLVDAVTAAYMLFLARGESVRLVWVRFAIMGLASAILWLIGLGLSIKGIEVVPRIAFVPALALTELGAGVMFFTWLGIMYRTTFRLRTSIRMMVFG